MFYRKKTVQKRLMLFGILFSILFFFSCAQHLYLRITPLSAVQFTKTHLALIHTGKFSMGSLDGSEDEKPLHTVQITRAFYMGKYEVTYDQYDRFCEDTGKSILSPDKPERETKPVQGISWYDALEYLNWLSKKHGLTPSYTIAGINTKCDFTADGYRLPTESEWEYAAKGGHKSEGFIYSGSDNPDEVAWFTDNSLKTVHPVGRKTPNKLGIYDMSGNAWEWCWDWYQKDYYSISPLKDPTGPSTMPEQATVYDGERVRRGGQWTSESNTLRSSYRSADGMKQKDNNGFRIVRTYSF